MCKVKKFTMEQKMMVLKKILEHKDILFGVFSDTLTKQLKSDKWKEVYDVARSMNIVSANKDWSYLRDTFWQNCRKYTFIKIENAKKKGGRQLNLNQCDELVLSIVGRDSESEPKSVDDIKLEEFSEASQDGFAPEIDFKEHQTSVMTSFPESSHTTARPPKRVLKSRIKKVKKQPVSQTFPSKKKRLLAKRIELLNYKTVLEIALLEQKLGIACSTYTENIFEHLNKSNNDDATAEEMELSLLKEENQVLSSNES